MTPRVFIWVTTSFIGYHRWKEAPNGLEFLRSWHRHVFKVKLGVKVEGLNREQEFFLVKGNLDAYLFQTFQGMKFEMSCEQLAMDICKHMDGAYCEVSEDGENGALVILS